MQSSACSRQFSLSSVLVSVRKFRALILQISIILKF
uniref:Uncharacterized protein n=1 Tax=Anguilla anguilla TaxID=7936 RepID=A0A0E9W854_ANGAN